MRTCAAAVAVALVVAAPAAAAPPGALPAGFAYSYGDAYRGWPVAPVNVQHPVRGAFLDPRGRDDDGLSGYHFGVDVSVDDRVPDPGAPPGMSHAVFAIEGGYVTEVTRNAAHRCLERRVEVGHFSYWHVSPTVQRWQRVRAGQQIGWTCRGVWHVHLSEWQRAGGVRTWVNPLHRGGKLAPYTDTAPPVVAALRFFGPVRTPWRPTTSLRAPDTAPPLRAEALHGRVEIRARIGDPQSFLGFLAQNPAWPSDVAPYRVALRIERSNGTTVLARTEFQADRLPQTPYLDHYAPGTVEADNMAECVGPPALRSCGGSYWLRPLSRLRLELWDTRRVPNGDYRVTVTAWDLAGNRGALSVPVVVAN